MRVVLVEGPPLTPLHLCSISLSCCTQPELLIKVAGTCFLIKTSLLLHGKALSWGLWGGVDAPPLIFHSGTDGFVGLQCPASGQTGWSILPLGPADPRHAPVYGPGDRKIGAIRRPATTTRMCECACGKPGVTTSQMISLRYFENVNLHGGFPSGPSG